MDEEESANLYGRVVALEVTTRTLMTALICQSFDDPIAGLRQVRQDTLSSLQNAQRPIGRFNDLAWEEAVEAMEQMFDAIELRITSMPRP